MFKVLFILSILFLNYSIVKYYTLTMLGKNLEPINFGFIFLVTSIFFSYILYSLYPFEPTIPNIFTVIASIFAILIGFYFLHRLKVGK